MLMHGHAQCGGTTVWLIGSEYSLPWQWCLFISWRSYPLNRFILPAELPESRAALLAAASPVPRSEVKTDQDRSACSGA